MKKRKDLYRRARLAINRAEDHADKHRMKGKVRAQFVELRLKAALRKIAGVE